MGFISRGDLQQNNFFLDLVENAWAKELTIACNEPLSVRRSWHRLADFIFGRGS